MSATNWLILVASSMVVAATAFFVVFAFAGIRERGVWRPIAGAFFFCGVIGGATIAGISAAAMLGLID